MSDDLHKGAAVGVGLLTVVASGARFCDDAARVGRVGAELAPAARLSDDIAVVVADDLLTLTDDVARSGDDVARARMLKAGEITESHGQGWWMIDRQDAVELTVDIGLELLGELEWDSGEVPLTPPVALISGLWISEDDTGTAPDSWMCVVSPDEDSRLCRFVYTDGGMRGYNGVISIREGVVCRTVLEGPALPGLGVEETLIGLNQRPCEQILAADGASVTLVGSQGPYTMRLRQE